MRVRSIFISDVHLGHRGSRANELLAFLAEVDARNIFVIGDLVDFWALGHSVCWPQAHQDVLRALVDRARSGVRVVYIPGNHDEAAREFAGMNICGIEIRRQHVHVTADGRRMLLLHGDEFDAAVRYGRWRVKLGSVIYSIALRINHFVYLSRRALGLREWSLTAWLKRQVANARAYIALFEEAAAAEPDATVATESSAGIFITRPCARSMEFSTATMATGSRAARRWSSRRTESSPSSTGLNFSRGCAHHREASSNRS